MNTPNFSRNPKKGKAKRIFPQKEGVLKVPKRKDLGPNAK